MALPRIGFFPAVNGCPNVRGSCNEPAFSTCADVSGYDSAELSSLQASCAVGGIGVFSTSPCDTSGYVGACKVLSGGGQCETVVVFLPGVRNGEYGVL